MKIFILQKICILLTLEVMFFVHNDVTFFQKIWTNAPMEPTCAANMQTARIPWALTAAFVKKDTQGMASLVRVGSCGETAEMAIREARRSTAFRLSGFFLKAGSAIDNFK